MVSVLNSGSKGPGTSPGRVMVCSWATLLSQCLSPTRSINEYSKLSGKPDKMFEGNLRWTSIPSIESGGISIFLVVASCYGNRDKLRGCGSFTVCLQHSAIPKKGLQHVPSITLKHLFL